MHDRIEKILDESGVSYRVRYHKDFPTPIQSPQDFANALGYEISRITKTLLLQAKDQEKFCLVVISSNKRVNLAKVAELMACKRMQMVDQETLLRVLDYPPTGVSPIGAGAIPVLMDEGLMKFETVLVGAGEVGVEVEMSPQAIKAVANAMSISLGM